MTRSEILFNYRQAIRQAEKIDDIADKIERLATVKLDNTVGSLRNNWNSDSSQRYYSKAGQVQGDINNNAKNLRRVASSIRSTAEAIKRAELRALEIARARSYKN